MFPSLKLLTQQNTFRHHIPSFRPLFFSRHRCKLQFNALFSSSALLNPLSPVNYSTEHMSTFYPFLFKHICPVTFHKLSFITKCSFWNPLDPFRPISRIAERLPTPHSFPFSHLYPVTFHKLQNQRRMYLLKPTWSIHSSKSYHRSYSNTISLLLNAFRNTTHSLIFTLSNLFTLFTYIRISCITFQHHIESSRLQSLPPLTNTIQHPFNHLVRSSSILSPHLTFGPNSYPLQSS